MAAPRATNRALSLSLAVVLAFASLAGCSRSASVETTSVDDAITQLAAGGVGVTSDVTSTAPVVALQGVPSAMLFTRWQLRNLVAEAEADNGYSGAELDALAPSPKGAPPLSALIVAWLRQQNPLANFARQRMHATGGAPGTQLFPSLVVLSFVADAARVRNPPPPAVHAFDIGPYIASPASAAGPCSDVSSWVSTVVTNVTNAVRANGSGWLASLWNEAVSVVGTAITIGYGVFAQPLLAFITRIATVTATLMQVSSLLHPWSVTLSAVPPSLMLNDVPQDGSFRARVDSRPIQWPNSLKDCVSTLSGINLDDSGYQHPPVRWTNPVGIPQLASSTTSDASLRDDMSAAYAYQTITSPKPEDAQCTATVPAGTIGITVAVDRSDVANVVTSLETLITNELPSGLRSYLQQYVQPAVNAATSAASKIGSPHASASSALTQLVADPLCLHTPPPAANTPTPESAVTRALPVEPCDQLLSPGDWSSSFPTASYHQPTDEEAQSTKWMLAFVPSTTSQFFDGKRGTFCIYMNAPQQPPTGPDDDDPAHHPQPAFIFFVNPPGDQPYHPLTADPSMPDQCMELFGPQLLAKFGADCRGVSNMIMVEDTHAQYIIASFWGTSGEPLFNVLRHLLGRL